MADEASYTKFLRFFTSRLVQTLVQARLGCKIEQLCSGHPEQPDWFNTRVDELGEIAAYLRTTIDEYPPVCKSLSIEFLLYTADGVYLPLESWVMSMDDETQSTVTTEFYHQLGTLLRSASAAARVTPMHRYFVKKQSQDTFVILYRIFKGSTTTELGQGAKEISIGVLPSPVGTVRLDLVYRTDMTVPQLASTEVIRENIERPAHVNRRRSRYTEDLPCRPSFSDCIPVSGGQVEQPLYSPPCPALKAESPIQSPSPERAPRFRIGRSTSSEESTQSLHLSSSQETKSCIFAPSKPVITHSESFPFASLLMSASPIGPRRNTTFCEDVFTGNLPFTTTVNIQEPTPPSEESEKISSPSPKHVPVFYDEDSGDEEEEEPLIFGQQQQESSTPTTLSEFIRECRTAPPNLHGFCAESPESLQLQLNEFISKEQEFTDFIQSVRDSIDEEE